MPRICISQFLNLFDFHGGEVVGRLVVAVDAEDSLKQPHLRQPLYDGPRDDDGIPFQVICSPSNGLLQPGQTVTLIILIPKEYAGRVSTRSETITQEVRSVETDIGDDNVSNVEDVLGSKLHPCVIKTVVTVYPAELSRISPRFSWATFRARFGISNNSSS